MGRRLEGFIDAFCTDLFVSLISGNIAMVVIALAYLIYKVVS